MRNLLLFLLLFSCKQIIAQNSVLSCDKMNVIYVGMKNPISIAVAGVKKENIFINASNNTKVIYKSSGEYYFIPEKAGKNCQVNITSKYNDGSIKKGDDVTFIVR